MAGEGREEETVQRWNGAWRKVAFRACVFGLQVRGIVESYLTQTSGVAREARRIRFSLVHAPQKRNGAYLMLVCASNDLRTLDGNNPWKSFCFNLWGFLLHFGFY